MSSDSPKKSNALIWAIIFVIGAIMLIWSISTSRTGQVWVTAESHSFSENPDGKYTETQAGSGDIEWTTYKVVPRVIRI